MLHLVPTILAENFSQQRYAYEGHNGRVTMLLATGDGDIPSTAGVVIGHGNKYNRGLSVR